MINQLFINGLIAGSIYALIALGFALIYGTTRFFHFVRAVIKVGDERGSLFPDIPQEWEKDGT